MARIRVFEDQFNDGTQSLPTFSGNGSVSEASGRLVISATGGTNMDWWTFGRNGVLPYTPANVYTPETYEVHFVTRIHSYTEGGSTAHSIFTVQESDTSGYWMGTDTGTDIFVLWLNNSSPITLGSVGSITLPIDIRVVWDRLRNTYTFQYQSAGVWTDIVADRASDLAGSPTVMGFSGKNYSGFPSFTVEYDYAIIDAYEADHIITTEGTEDRSKTGVEDESSFPAAGGPTKHGTEFSAGQLIPGPVDQQPGSVGPFDIAGAEDESSILAAGGDDTGFLLGLDNNKLNDADSIEDLSTVAHGGIPDYSITTTDAYSTAHFTTVRPYLAYLYESDDEPWANPVENSLTGYARDGYEYISGAIQASQAPWASESSSANRSPRFRFPSSALLVVASSELIIFDLDNYPTDLSVWMRFLVGDSGNFYLLGRVANSIKSVSMKNGVLLVATASNGIEVGGMFAIDFKATGQNFLTLVRSDNHWQGVGGRDITDRNITGNFTTTGVSPSLRVDPEDLYSIDGYFHGSTMWVAVSGEDPSPYVIQLANNVGEYDYEISRQGGEGAFDIGDARKVLFDGSSWIWWTANNRIYRGLLDYQSGVMIGKTNGKIHKSVLLKDLSGNTAIIKDMVFLGKYIYVGTDLGVFQINRATLDFHLAYTVPGDGGRGSEDIEGAGEILAGTVSSVSSISAFRTFLGGHLEVATNFSSDGVGGVTLIRTSTDTAIDSREFDFIDGYESGTSLIEPGALFNISFRV